MIERHVERTGRLLEAGCGLGQYVLLLRERGLRAVGTDWSFEAVRRGARAGAPIAVMDLRALAVRSETVTTYLSLGVVEHDFEGPAAIVREAARVLTPGGVLLLSVPYWNGVRRLFGPYVASTNARTRARGGQFYQYAFSRGEVRTFLRAHGFAVRSFHPYDPARLFRKARRALTRTGSRPTKSEQSVGPEGDQRGARRSATARALRALLYTSPALRLLGHMILAVAVKA